MGAISEGYIDLQPFPSCHTWTQYFFKTWTQYFLKLRSNISLKLELNSLKFQFCQTFTFFNNSLFSFGCKWHSESLFFTKLKASQRNSKDFAFQFLKPSLLLIYQKLQETVKILSKLVILSFLK